MTMVLGAGDVVPRASHRAVLQAAGVAVAGRADVAALSGLLYGSGTAPATPLRRRLWDGEGSAQAVRLLGRAVTGLQDGYRCHRTAHWSSWNRRDLDEGPSQPLRHKVYVSPQPEHHLVALRRALDVAVSLGVPGWKTGVGSAGVLRPDSTVLYCADARSATALAEALVEALADLPARGVPFTGQVGSTGLVSRGTDPPGTSWRAHVVGVLADELHRVAGTAGAGALGNDARSVAGAALDAAARGGLDVVTWWPAASAAGRWAA